MLWLKKVPLLWRFAFYGLLCATPVLLAAQSTEALYPPERVLHFGKHTWSGSIYLERWGSPMGWEEGEPNRLSDDVYGTRGDVKVPAGMQTFLSYSGDDVQQFATNAEAGGIENSGFDHDQTIKDSLETLSKLDPMGIQYLNLIYVYARSNKMALGKILAALKGQKAFFGMQLWNSNIRSDDLKPLMDHPTFRALRLYKTNLDGSLFSAIKGHPGLQHIELITVGGEGSLFDGMETLPNMKKLTIQEGRFDEIDMASIGKSASLTTLTMVLCKEDWKSISHLRPCEHLKFFAFKRANLDEMRGDPGFFDLIASMPNLRQLDLTLSNVIDDDIPKIIAARNLQQIDLNGTDVTSEGIARLRAKRPDLDIIY